MPSAKVQDIIAHLFDRFVTLRRLAPKGIVVLVGAGCSMQYGLPSFRELLERVYDEHWGPFHQGRSGDMSIDALKDELNNLWSCCGPDEIRAILSPHLTNVRGDDCRGYRILVDLVKQGFVHSIVDMNFDTLLEEAFEAEGLFANQGYAVSQSLQARPHDVMLYKIHGSLRPDGGEPVLSIEHGHLFGQPAEGDAAARLLSENHVLVLGYSGGDTKIIHALSSSKNSENLKEHKLIVANVDGPGVDFPLVQESRRSRDLSVIGEDASFSSFMEHIYNQISHPIATRVVHKASAISRPDYMTKSERNALECCQRLALRIRATINVADYSSFRLEEHAEDLFHRVFEISIGLGVPLTEAEKHLVRSAAYFHDLGFFWARSGYNRAINPGLKLLHDHGQQTKELLHEFLIAKDIGEGVVPSSYDDDSRDTMIRLIEDLCRLHATFHIDEKSARGPAAWPKTKVSIMGFGVSVRFDLVHALFLVAEETLSGHPWIPPTDLAFPGAADVLSAIEDPITDLYWRHQGVDIRFRVLSGKLVASLEPSVEISSSSTRWLLRRIGRAAENLNRIGQLHKARELVLNWSVAEEGDEAEVVSAALTEALKTRLDKLPTTSVGRASSLLDLLSIYVLPLPESSEGHEPRVELEHEVVQQVIMEVEQTSADQHPESLLKLYFSNKRTDKDVMTQRFCDSFEEILYPAWRFLAQHWSLGINPVSFAPLVFSLGSSRFRTELAMGMQSLLRDKIYEGKLEPNSYYGHSGCMQCTGQLIFSFATLRQRLSEPEIEKFIPDLNDRIRGLLAFVLSKRLLKGDWLGLFEERSKGKRRIQSISYTAWAIHGLVRLLLIEQEIRREKPEGWLGPDCGTPPEDVLVLASKKWRELCKLRKPKITSSVTEMGFTQSLLDTSLCWLELRKLDSSVRIPEWFLWAYNNSVANDPCKLNRFKLIPAMIALADTEEGIDFCREMVRTAEECFENPVWITRGDSRGSWGYNADMTAALTSALLAFWLYVFEDREKFKPFFSPRI